MPLLLPQKPWKSVSGQLRSETRRWGWSKETERYLERLVALPGAPPAAQLLPSSPSPPSPSSSPSTEAGRLKEWG